MSRERGTRRELLSSIEQALALARPHLVQKNPYLPDLLNQPDFLAVPQLGRLVSLHVYAPRERLTWRSVLAAVEDLFEIKLATGESTVAAGLLVKPPSAQENDQLFIDLLRNYFDVFIVSGQDADALSLPRLVDHIFDAHVRDALFQLWELERRRVTENLEQFSEEKYPRFVDQNNRLARKKSTLMRELEASFDEPDLKTTRRYQVRSPKEPLAGLPERNRFQFDFGVEFLPTNRIRLVELAVLGRFGSRQKLRYLMTKARLTSYEMYDGRLVLSPQRLSPVLMIGGNVSGPSHDPYRYVRALVSVGWELLPATPDAAREVAYADL